MKQFRIRFFHGTDLRGEHIVTAFDDRGALALSLHTMGYKEWVSGPDFRIEITRA